MTLRLTNDNLSHYFSLPNADTSAVVCGENPYSFVGIGESTDTLLITIGDSWTWGDDLDEKIRLNSVFGGVVSNELKADFLNLGEPGAGNWHIVRKIKELAQIASTLDYKKIIVISTFTETARDFNSKDDLEIDYQSWLLNNITDADSYNGFLKFINQQIADQIHQQLLTFDSRYEFYFATNFVEPLGFEVLQQHFFDKSWLQVICDRQGIDCRPDLCYLVSPWIIEKFDTVFEFVPDLNRNTWLEWINALTDSANLRAQTCRNDQDNFLQLMHPTKKNHSCFAEYVLSKLINFYELKLENDQLLNIFEFVKFCVDHQGKDIVLQVNNEGHCLTYCGVYNILDLFKFNSVTINTSNALEKNDRYVVNSNWDIWLNNIEEFDFSYDYAWSQQKIFGCFYGRPSAPRLGIVAHLAKYHSDKSHVQTKFNFSSVDSRKLFDLQRLFSWQADALDTVNYLEGKTYTGEESYIKGEYYWDNSLSYLYKNFLIDLVVEPVCQGTTFYPTEKTVRPILCRRPFIIMGSRNYLDYMHQLGFLTFNNFWSEDYDGFDGSDRYFKILDLIDQIATKSRAELLDLYYAMTYQLDHNYKVLVEQSYSTEIKLIP